MLNEQQHLVTPNLDFALRHIRLPTEIRVLWVDALCIDQANTIEKGHQISLMRDIYQNCQTDLAWLSEPVERNWFTPDPEQVARGLKCMEEICEKATQEAENQEGWRPWSAHHEPYSRAHGLNIKQADFVDGPARRPSVWPTHDADSDILPERFEYGLHSILEAVFSKNPFWNRVWIVQELAYSPEVILLAPNSSLNWRSISAYLGGGRYEEALDRSRTAISGHSPAAVTKFGYTFEKVKAIEYQRSLVEELRKGGRTNLMDSLIRFRMTDSTDPRDKVYALLGLASQLHGIVPDYKKSKEQLFAEVSLALINTSATIDVICQNYWQSRLERKLATDSFGVYEYTGFDLQPKLIGGEESPTLHIPTWAANFSSKASSSQLQTYFLFAQRSVFCAGKPVCRVPCTVTSNGKVLQLRGAAIGKISKIYDEKGGGRPYISYKHQLRIWMEAVLGKSIPSASSKRYEATQETCFRAFWRTVVMDCSAYPIRRLREDELDLEEDKYRALLRKVCKPETDYDLGPDGNEDGQPVSLEVLQRNAASWVFCVTDSGFYTMSLRGMTRPGDLVLVLDGGKVPVLVRPVAKECPPEHCSYEIVHVVYAHGFMNGETEKWIEEARLKESEFLII